MRDIAQDAIVIQMPRQWTGRQFGLQAIRTVNNDGMKVPIRAFLLTAFLFIAYAQSPEFWRGKTSENRDIAVSVVKGEVTSVSVSLGISCADAVDEGTKVFAGPSVPVSGKTMKFAGQTVTSCGAVQLRLEGTIEGKTASGTLTITPPKLADNPAKKKLTWKAEEDLTRK